MLHIDYGKCSKYSILNNLINLPQYILRYTVLKANFWYFFEWPLKTGFTVLFCSLIVEQRDTASNDALCWFVQISLTSLDCHKCVHVLHVILCQLARPRNNFLASCIEILHTCFDSFARV